MKGGDNMSTDKVRNLLFGNPVVNECNDILNSCKTKDDRMRAATLIRSKINLGPIHNKLLRQGNIGAIY